MSETSLNHPLQRMLGRDPNERGRVASSLELLFDLTFAVAFSTAGAQFAELIAAGRIGAGLAAYSFACFGIVWAWINFSWFSSAYDTDDWLHRLLTMVQMCGVVIFALGLPPMFASVAAGDHLDNKVMVLGYVVMRVAMAAHWGRAWLQDPGRRAVSATYLVTILVAQIGWVVQAYVPLTLWPTVAFAAVLVAIELTGPVVAEFFKGGTPWHAHHIAERYSLLAIITLGEGIIGTIATLSASVEEHGWTLEPVLVVVAGVGLTFALWWFYFAAMLPDVLHHHRERAFGFGYSHIVIFSAIAATGAGLHVAGLVIEGEARISTFWAVASVAIPVLLFVVSSFALWSYLARRHDTLHTVQMLGTISLLVLSVLLARWGVGMGWCLLVTMLAPIMSVVLFETVGHRHAADVLGELDAEHTPG